MLVVSHVNQCRDRIGHKVYVGRNFGGHKGSPLGNPFKADPEQPGATLPDYKRWLWNAMRNPNSPQSKELQRIKEIWQRAVHTDVILTCWCHDAHTCHGSVIAKAIKYLDSIENASLQ